MKRSLLGFLLILFTLAACTQQQPSSNPPSDAQSNQAWNGQIKEFTVRAFQYNFEPNTIEVNKGDKVIIRAFSSDVPHGFTLADFNVNLKLDSPEKKTVEFIADKAGTFTFGCTVPCGAGHTTMKGTFIVKE